VPFTDSIWDIWAAADIAVVPSTEPEAFGLVALEAMAARKPVLAADHGGLPEIVKDGVTGLLVPPNDAVALSAAMRRLIELPALREELGTNGTLRFREDFTLGTFLRNMESVYAQLLG
jgi:glycosyltransferase involved in cell wall biosynthesis